MLKKLKIKFVTTTMILLFIVIISALFMITITNYRYMTKQVISSLEQSISFSSEDDIPRFNHNKYNNASGNPSKQNNNNDIPPKSGSDFLCDKKKPTIGHKPHRDVNINLSNVVIKLNEDNTISHIYENNASIETNTLNEAINIALSNNNTFGRIASLGLFYYSSQKADNQYIAFSDTAAVDNTFKQHIIINTFMLVICMSVFFFISLFLANISVKPVSDAWNQQKQFVADASHELKTPLTVMLANSNILLSNPDSTISEQQKWIISTQEEALLMKQLVEDMLYLAKADAGVNLSTFGTVNLSDIATSSMLQFEPVAFENSIILDSDIEENINVSGDETKLTQLVRILLDNACKYCGTGKKVLLTLSKTTHDIKLCVNNNGPVIPNEDIEHIFERFYRSDKARQRQGGSGLGLSIAQSICEEHNGTLSVESTKENGTTFTFKLDINPKL